LTREFLKRRPNPALLSALGHLDAHETALVGLYGDETLDQATDLIDGDLRFFGLQSPGLNLEGCAMHQCLLKQYESAHPVAVNT
jgi:ribosomal protein S12 methylthiotransferase accessory factor